jgi:hypothetical protein
MAPFSEEHHTDRPASLDAATKRADEAIAHAYNHIYGLSITGLHFFTVYGSWGRGRGGVESSRRAAAGLEVFWSGTPARDEGASDDDTEAQSQPRAERAERCTAAARSLVARCGRASGAEWAERSRIWGRGGKDDVARWDPQVGKENSCRSKLCFRDKNMFTPLPKT